jgi:hypothetical protein
MRQKNNYFNFKIIFFQSLAFNRAITVKIISKTWFVLIKRDLDRIGMLFSFLVLLTLTVESGFINDL